MQLSGLPYLDAIAGGLHGNFIGVTCELYRTKDRQQGCIWVERLEQYLHMGMENRPVCYGGKEVIRLVKVDANGRKYVVSYCNTCGKVAEGVHTCSPNPVIEALLAENARLKDIIRREKWPEESK